MVWTIRMMANYGPRATYVFSGALSRRIEGILIFYKQRLLISTASNITSEVIAGSILLPCIKVVFECILWTQLTLFVKEELWMVMVEKLGHFVETNSFDCCACLLLGRALNE